MTTKKTTTKRAAKKTTAKKATGNKPKAAAKTTAKKPAAKTGDTKMNALDAAAKVLGESKEPLNAKTMIERMATKGYWTSPGGKTPHATLYAAIIREIQTKGNESRFQKTDRGHFALNK